MYNNGVILPNNEALFIQNATTFPKVRATFIRIVKTLPKVEAICMPEVKCENDITFLKIYVTFTPFLPLTFVHSILCIQRIIAIKIIHL